MGRVLFCLLVSSCLATPSFAIPTTYFFTAGSATVTALDLADSPSPPGNNLVFSGLIPLSGVFVTFDAAANGGNGALTDLEFSVPTTGTFDMAQIYGGFDRFVIESANILPGDGFSSTDNLHFGGGLYSFKVSPLDINGVYSAFLSTDPGNVFANDLVVPFTDTESISGILNLGAGTLDLTGITLAELDGASFGELGNLSIKADISFTGGVPEQVVPEPSVALLVVGGLAVLSVARRRTLGRKGRVLPTLVDWPALNSRRVGAGRRAVDDPRKGKLAC